MDTAPFLTSLAAGESSEFIYTWVNAAGVTDSVGPGEGLSVSLGFGESDADPETEWFWTETSYNTDKDGLEAGDLANDEFSGVIEAPETPGTYRYAARARIGEGPWLHCDLGGEACGGDGSQDGFSVESSGELLVTAP